MTLPSDKIQLPEMKQKKLCVNSEVMAMIQQIR